MTTRRKLAARFPAYFKKYAKPLSDVSKLRNQAVFSIGAPGSGKGYVLHKWLKYMPGEGPGGATREVAEARSKEYLPETERGLTPLDFKDVAAKLRRSGIQIEATPEGAKVPFQLWEYDSYNNGRAIPPSEWKTKLPADLYEQVQGLADSERTFGAPKHEGPGYFRQINPDLYKEEIPGYAEKNPGFVHEMSVDMSKAYFEAALKTGDPIIVDGTGSNFNKIFPQIKAAQDAGYRITLVWVWAPLTVSHIRNATRARSIKPRLLNTMYQSIAANFPRLKGVVDKAKMVDNRNTAFDMSLYRKQKNKIEAFIQNAGYDSLYDLISQEMPKELKDYGEMLKEGASKQAAAKLPNKADQMDYAEYLFHELHHGVKGIQKPTKEQKQTADAFHAQGWPTNIMQLPAARAMYLELCAEFAVEPEVGKTASDSDKQKAMMQRTDPGKQMSAGLETLREMFDGGLGLDEFNAMAKKRPALWEKYRSTFESWVKKGK